ncbi:2,3,4,5-tetrahydropyridine-2,6-dicarboxylate N-succinyltransferase [Candidatus Tremblaya phenacola]|nr:2,3,4,5-tetrahydropyridine-2,6-dicarboxylate N-succinyltransferase [Candidatus Tremblaya phenacola]
MEQIWNEEHLYESTAKSREAYEVIEYVISELDAGKIRVCEKRNGVWQVNEWIKKAILLYFRLAKICRLDTGYSCFYDKIPLKFISHTEKHKVRNSPPGSIRRGSFISRNVVLMPSFINIGAYVDEGTMVDTWSTIGSCAQVGKSVHISGGVGIGGVLEPLNEQPVIIEDNCFIGARSEIVEGVVIEEGSVIAMGVYIGQSTKIYDRERDDVLYGRVPAGSVVVPGGLIKDGKYSLGCAVIVKRIDRKTLLKTSINELLR